MIYDRARELARLLSDSEEYRNYKQTRERAFESDTTKALVKEYSALRMKAQAAMMSGNRDEDAMAKLQKLGELLQLNPDASAYLFAEYRLNTMLGDVYKILAEAIDIDLGGLEG